MKTIKCIVTVAACCLVTLAVTSALPVSTADDFQTTTELDSSTQVPVALPVVGQYNGSKLVITAVKKTLEFTVGVIVDDENSTDNALESSTPVIETDIQVLDPLLLKDLLKAEQEQELELSTEVYPTSIDGTNDPKNEAES